MHLIPFGHHVGPDYVSASVVIGLTLYRVEINFHRFKDGSEHPYFEIKQVPLWVLGVLKRREAQVGTLSVGNLYRAPWRPVDAFYMEEMYRAMRGQAGDALRLLAPDLARRSNRFSAHQFLDLHRRLPRR
ncbi:hypothetical protein FHG66_05960 [Rubellimicrobium rubrum]|uniref:Uncharacterized protein n=1 Tax=Rubellimicrobium rubrum TaxID=2585369 RepID=A0A5C4MY79_9RHOB|nr:hypothetical protein [Rubellimicrobium rubrum]TNC51096.1 hypothetical protein FHG66_05960 [Rubellimicrobium rubrum]